MKKVQLGCGSNFLEDWENHDADVDITKQLPFDSNSIDILFSEHCIEHISFKEFKSFLSECYRVIKQDGVIRLTTPCLDKLLAIKDKNYIEWTDKKFSQRIPNFCNMLNTMFRAHGHQYIYDKDTLDTLLINAKFKKIKFYEPGSSEINELKNIEYHWRKISKEFNDLESISVEGVKTEDKY